MGIDYLVCSKCGEGFPDCNDYYRCFVCEELASCELKECQKKAIFKYNNNKYYLCGDCYPSKYKIVRKKIINKNYEEDLKFIENEIDDIEKEKND